MLQAIGLDLVNLSVSGDLVGGLGNWGGPYSFKPSLVERAVLVNRAMFLKRAALFCELLDPKIPNFPPVIEFLLIATYFFGFAGFAASAFTVSVFAGSVLAFTGFALAVLAFSVPSASSKPSGM